MLIFEKISITTLEDLFFIGNPLREQIKDRDDYWIENVQKILKSLKKLDGLILI